MTCLVLIQVMFLCLTRSAHAGCMFLRYVSQFSHRAIASREKTSEVWAVEFNATVKVSTSFDQLANTLGMPLVDVLSESDLCQTCTSCNTSQLWNDPSALGGLTLFDKEHHDVFAPGRVGSLT